MTPSDLKLFSGSSNRALALDIAKKLGISLADAKVGRFSDGETRVEITESVRGSHAFVLQSTSAPVNEHVMETLVMIDALKRASAFEITAVIPYYGYSRQDRKVAPRAPITAKLVADLLESAGATRVISMDLHAGQIQGFFNIPFDNLYATPVMLEDIRTRYQLSGHDDDFVIVAPDAGGVERARAFAKRLKVGLAIIDKRRDGPNVAQVMNIIGDVQGKRAVLVDDLIDTAGTITKAASALVEHGARSVSAYATHPVLSGPALERVHQSPLEKLVVSDTIALNAQAQSVEQIEQLSVSKLIAEAIRRIHQGESVSTLFI